MHIGDGIVKMTGAEFDALPEYSASLPTGTTIGRQWKVNRVGLAPHWWMGMYTRELPMPTCCRYHRCIAGVVNSVPCSRVRTAEGVEYNPANPDAWHERPNRQIEIAWYRIICFDRKIFGKLQCVELPVHLL